MNLQTYLRAGHPGIAVISSEEARAEAEIASACSELGRRLHAWSSTEGLVDTAEGRVTPCPDPLEALQQLDGRFASGDPRQVVLLRDRRRHLVARVRLVPELDAGKAKAGVRRGHRQRRV